MLESTFSGFISLLKNIIMEKMKAPWGWQKSIVKKNNYHLKELVILPGKKISLQKHFKRSELWTVIKGEALVNLEKEEIFLKENESIYIPKGSTHRASNEKKANLEILEIQIGSYLEEDDIVRFEDMFGRATKQPKKRKN